MKPGPAAPAGAQRAMKRAMTAGSACRVAAVARHLTAPASAPAAAVAPANPVILDCDTGADDAVAILMAAASPRCRLLGVTTCQGNTPVANVTENSLRTLEAAGFTNIPVIQGAAVALDGTFYDPRAGGRVQAPAGFSATVDTVEDVARLESDSFEQTKLLELPAAVGKRTGGPDAAAQWLVDTIHANPGVALIPTGPMTNIALGPFFPSFSVIFNRKMPFRRAFE